MPHVKFIFRACTFFYIFQGQEEIQDYCKEHHIAHLVVLKDVASGFVKVRSIEKERAVEKRVNISEVADYMLQKYQYASPFIC